MSNVNSKDAVYELGWFDLSDAPPGSGLYAWYLHPELRVGDLHDKALTIENVCHLAEQLRIPNLQVSADGHLSLQMEGWLDHIHLGHRQEEGITPHVDRVLSDEKTRQLFAQVLRYTRPYLMAPLYIGVATNLRERLDQHRRSIESGGEKFFPDYPPAHSFAREICARGIPPRRLFVHVLPVAALCDPTTPRQTQREVAEAVETLLNRLFYPILGRR